MQRIVPPVLQKGDEIRVIAPSRGIKIIGQDARAIATRRFEEMGLKVSYGRHTTDDNWDMFGSSAIDQRVDDLMEAFGDPKVKAVFTIIGGFNSNMLLPFLDYELIKKNPKIFCGFSDITALLNGIYAKTGLVTFSGPHFSSIGMLKGIGYTLENLRKMLFGPRCNEVTPSAEWSDDLWFIDQEKRDFIPNEGYWLIRGGMAEGTVIGGNLGTFNLLQGTPYRPEFKENTIFFAEDCFTSGVDDTVFLRELQSVAQQPDFGNVKALVIGRFQKASEMTREKMEYIIRSIPQLEGLPVLANVDFGHTTPLLTLPIGGKALLQDGRLSLSL